MNLELPKSDTRLLPPRSSPPKLELRLLPKRHEYAYLGDNETFLDLIYNTFIIEQEAKLVRLLREHSEALGHNNREIKSTLRKHC